MRPFHTLLALFLILSPVASLSAQELVAESPKDNTAIVTPEGDFSYENTPLVQEQNGIRFVTGGVGDEERQQLSTQASAYNLKVVNAASDGDYVGTADLTLLDASGKTLVNVPSVDPLFYATLPAGRYTVETRYNGETKRQAVTIGGKKPKPANVHFTWKAMAQ